MSYQDPTRDLAGPNDDEEMMAMRLGHVILLSVFGASCALGACGDDDGSTPPSDDGGAGGAPGATGEGGAPAAGSPSAGNDAGGEGGLALPAPGGAPSVGGADAAGAGGAGAGGEAALVYACSDTSIYHRVCSALSAANCADPTDCADCVTTRAADGESYESCAACAAEFRKFVQCGIDAFESGNLSAGVECYEGFGADLNDACGEHLSQAVACHNEEVIDGCPSTWPKE